MLCYDYGSGVHFFHGLYLALALVLVASAGEEPAGAPRGPQRLPETPRESQRLLEAFL